MLPPAKTKTERGFTLIELMIAIAIIGILAAIAIPNYISYRKKALVAEAQSELKNIEKAVTALTADTGFWPNKEKVGQHNTAEAWNLNAAAAGLTSTDGSYPDWAGPYFGSIPPDPWGNNYFFDIDYQINGSDYIVIGSFGPNGVGPNAYDADDIVIVLAGPI